MLDYKLFKEELPADGRIILYGNHRGMKTRRYTKDWRWQNEYEFWKPVTHWTYIELPASDEEALKATSEW